MATYTNLPPSLSAILAPIVAHVSDELSAQIGNTVKFKHNSFTALMDELKNEATAPSLKNDRYPLIGLIQPFVATPDTNNESAVVKCDIIICTLSDKNKTADQRESTSYDTVLRPIYAEFMQRLSTNRLIDLIGGNTFASHMDIYHMGDSRGGKNSYQLPDVVDAIVIEGLEMQIYPEPCLVDATWPTSTLRYQNDVKSISCSAVLSNRIGVTLNDFTYLDIDNIGFGDGTPTFRVYFGHNGSSSAIVKGQTVTRDFTSEDGSYIGTISCDDGVTIATIQFKYVVSHGQLTSYSESVIFYINTFDTTGANYPYNNFTVHAYSRYSTATIESRDITQDGGTIVYNEIFDPNVTIAPDTNYTLQTTLPNVMTEVGNDVTIGGVDLESLSYFKLIIN